MAVLKTVGIHSAFFFSEQMYTGKPFINDGLVSVLEVTVQEAPRVLCSGSVFL